jgi:hypothetical protein
MNCSDIEILLAVDGALQGGSKSAVEGTVKSRLNRGRAELARVLRKQKVAI